MPTSSPSNLSWVIKAVQNLGRLNSVLDVGAGFGKYGFLMREYLDVVAGRIHKKDWAVTIEAIEPHVPYASLLALRGIYNTVYIETVQEFQKRQCSIAYDLVMMCDVIEHMHEEEGKATLAKFIKTSKFVLVTSPEGMLVQGPINGNELEKHVSGWTLDKITSAYPNGLVSFFRNDPFAIILKGA